MQLESVVASWEAGDHSLLQPTIANLTLPLSMITMLCRKVAGEREVELHMYSGGRVRLVELDTTCSKNTLRQWRARRESGNVTLQQLH